MVCPYLAHVCTCMCTCMHMHTHTHTLSLSLSHPAGKDDGGHWCSGSELLHKLLKPHAEVGVQWQGILEQATQVGQPLCARWGSQPL